MNTRPQCTDVVGREIKVGDVLLHISRKGSAIYTDVGVVRRIGPDGSFLWSKLRDNSWRGTPSHFAPQSMIYRTRYCVVLPDMTEAGLKVQYGIE